MNGHPFHLSGAALVARPSGALWWPAARLLCVSDLHMGKSERAARRSGTMLPPYEVADTLRRLAAEIGETDPAVVLCLGDSFDDRAAADALPPAAAGRLAELGVGRRWVWVEGNHDPGPLGLPGEALAELRFGPLLFRHQVQGDAPAGEVSGHFHPKAGVALGFARVTRPCFLFDARRVVLPAFGTYTGGLSWTDPALRALFPGAACAVLTGTTACPVPVPARRHGRSPSRPPRVPALGRP